MSRFCVGGHARHWFTVWGNPGLRVPACMRCGEPNPQPLTHAQWDELIVYRERRGYAMADPIEKLLVAEVQRRRARGPTPGETVTAVRHDMPGLLGALKEYDE
jgi:hypothetical protein